MTKEFLVLECININAWYNTIRSNKKLNGLSVPTLWALKKNMSKINDVVTNFNEFKESLESELKENYFNDEKSETTTITNDDGTTSQVQKVKDEYINEYQEEVNRLNGKLNDLAMTKETFDFSPIDMDKEIERIGESCSLDMDDLDMLSAFEDDEKDA